MKKKRIIITIIATVIFLGIINHERIQFLYYFLSNTSNTKQTIEKEYNISVNIVMQKKNIHLYEGLDKKRIKRNILLQLLARVYLLFMLRKVSI